jgi:hypothetical protein
MYHFAFRELLLSHYTMLLIVVLYLAIAFLLSHNKLDSVHLCVSAANSTRGTFMMYRITVKYTPLCKPRVHRRF